jgi:transposase
MDECDRRQLHRELIELKAQRTEHTNRIKGVLPGIGLSYFIDVVNVKEQASRPWVGRPLLG